ncbi:unnamed protein product [Arabis nemorensis]|uniref:Rad60/SUMO-like domain-containing protein n=1 Tax=Arabis nemorensis TaxID=586526 RepID=A0A565ARQ9_9BRAS|nr:unnamed protein product [Arabis nemorensis]
MVNSVSKRCVAPKEKKVILKIRNQHDGGEDVYKMSVDVHLKKLMLAYCDKRNFNYKTARFIYKGNFLKPRQTPAKLMMEYGDVIYMHGHQISHCPVLTSKARFIPISSSFRFHA